MWALIVDNSVSELTDIDPAGRFHPSMEWVSVGSSVEVGMVRNGKTFAHPVESETDAQARINAEARSYLSSTDWYVLRQQETGEAIPEDIIAARAAARERVVDV